MTPLNAIYILLDSNATLSTIRADRCYNAAQGVPQADSLPFQTMALLDMELAAHLKGDGGVDIVGVQVDSFSMDGDEANTMATETRDTLGFSSGQLVTNPNDGDDTLRMRHVRLQDQDDPPESGIRGTDTRISRVRQEFLMSYET